MQWDYYGTPCNLLLKQIHLHLCAYYSPSQLIILRLFFSLDLYLWLAQILGPWQTNFDNMCCFGAILKMIGSAWKSAAITTPAAGRWRWMPIWWPCISAGVTSWMAARSTAAKGVGMKRSGIWCGGLMITEFLYCFLLFPNNNYSDHQPLSDVKA